MTKKFFAHVLPAMLAFAFSGLYTIVDGFFIGRSIGDAGLAAVNIAFPLTALIQAVGTGIGMGGAVQISVCRGKNDARGEERYLSGTLVLLAASGVCLTAALVILGRPVLASLGAQGDVLEAALSYLNVIALGTLCQLCATGFTPLLRNCGASMRAMFAMIAGFAVNIALDALFVRVLHYGMAGAAWATVAGQAVTVVPCALFLLKKARAIPVESWRPRGRTAAAILRVAVSPFGLTMSPNVILMLMNKSAVIYGGETAVAAYAVVSYVTAVIQLLLQGVGDGSQPLISFYLGMDQLLLAKKVRGLAFAFSGGVALLNMAALYALCPHIPGFFGASSDASPIAAGALPIFLLGFPFIAFCRTAASYFYAVRSNALAYVMVYGEPLLLSVLLALFLPKALGLSGVWLSVPLAQMFLALTGLILLSRGPKQAKQSESESKSGEESGTVPAAP